MPSDDANDDKNPPSRKSRTPARRSPPTDAPPPDDGRCHCDEGWIAPCCVGRCPIAERLIREACRSVSASHSARDYADDAAQEVALYLMRQYPADAFRTRQLRREAFFALHTLLKAKGGAWHPVQRRTSSLTLQHDGGEYENDVAAPEEDPAGVEGVDKTLREALKILTPIQRFIVTRHEGVLGHPKLTWDAIVEHLRAETGDHLWSVARVKDRYHHAMHRMRPTR